MAVPCWKRRTSSSSPRSACGCSRATEASKEPLPTRFATRLLATFGRLGSPARRSAYAAESRSTTVELLVPRPAQRPDRHRSVQLASAAAAWIGRLTPSCRRYGEHGGCAASRRAAQTHSSDARRRAVARPAGYLDERLA